MIDELLSPVLHNLTTKSGHRVLMCLACMLAHRACAKDMFKCKFIFDCIPQPRVHDGISDCYDGSDEEDHSMNSS